MNLNNDETWTTQDGQTLRLVDMEMGHRRNLLGYLRRRAEGLKLRADLRLCSVAGPNGDAASDAFEHGCDMQFEMPAVEWLEETPLVTRLRALAGEEGPRAQRLALMADYEQADV